MTYQNSLPVLVISEVYGKKEETQFNNCEKSKMLSLNDFMAMYGTIFGLQAVFLLFCVVL